MGLGIGVSRDSFDYYDDKNQVVIIKEGNPNPNNYEIVSHTVSNSHLILHLRYPDCKNYEGSKVLVFDKGITLNELLKQKLIDPHFSENESKISPIARFEPTVRGWRYAMILTKNLKESDIKIWKNNKL